MKAAGPLYTEWMSTPSNREQLTKACFAELQKCDGDLKGFERVKAIYLESYVSELGSAFTPKNNLMTPSVKLQRPNLRAYYVVELKAMYTKLGMPPAEGETWL